MTGKKIAAAALGILVAAAGFLGAARFGQDRILPAFCQTESKTTENNRTEKTIKKVALTFDDGPNPDYTGELLDGLKTRNVKATFFVLGKQAKQYPQLTKRIAEEGHLLGCHGYDHINLASLSMEEACRQMTETADLILDITGSRPMFMRPPYGKSHVGMEEKVQMIEVLWDIDTMDWALRSPDRVVQETLAKAEDGSIILMHDEFQESVDAALQLTDALKKEGYQFVTVEELILE